MFRFLTDFGMIRIRRQGISRLVEDPRFAGPDNKFTSLPRASGIYRGDPKRLAPP